MILQCSKWCLVNFSHLIKLLWLRHTSWCSFLVLLDLLQDLPDDGWSFTVCFPALATWFLTESPDVGFRIFVFSRIVKFDKRLAKSHKNLYDDSNVCVTNQTFESSYNFLIHRTNVCFSSQNSKFRPILPRYTVLKRKSPFCHRVTPRSKKRTALKSRAFFD